MFNVKVDFVRDLWATGSLYGLGTEECRECYDNKNERCFGEKHIGRRSVLFCFLERRVSDNAVKCT